MGGKGAAENQMLNGRGTPVRAVNSQSVEVIFRFPKNTASSNFSTNRVRKASQKIDALLLDFFTPNAQHTMMTIARLQSVVLSSKIYLLLTSAGAVTKQRVSPGISMLPPK